MSSASLVINEYASTSQELVLLDIISSSWFVQSIVFSLNILKKPSRILMWKVGVSKRRRAFQMSPIEKYEVCH